MAQTSSQQSNANITIQMMVVVLLRPSHPEIQMSFSTMAAELMTSASSVLFFAPLLQSFQVVRSGAILTATSEGNGTVSGSRCTTLP